MELTLETERLLLRPFRMEDAQAMYTGWASDPEVTKYLTWNAHDSVETTEKILRQWVDAYQKPERLNFAIELKSENRLIGVIEVVGYLNGVNGTPVIGYALARDAWNHGYMTEACSRVLAYLFQRGYSEVRIDAMCENVGSNRVIQKCGGVCIRTEEDRRPLKNDTVTVNRYIVKAPPKRETGVL